MEVRQVDSEAQREKTFETMDTLRIYVLWHPGSANRRLAERIVRHFDGLGMERDGVSHRVPVRVRSEPWLDGNDQQAPRPINLGSAKYNAIVLLHDEHMAADANTWDPYVQTIKQAIRARGNIDCYIPFQGSRAAKPLPSDSGIQYARRYAWRVQLGTEDAADTHALLWLLYLIRRKLRENGPIGQRPEPLFVSHAKADGDSIARTIIDHINNSSQDIPLHTFYDAKQLIPGQSYQDRFKDEIESGTLLAIVSDVYDSRPWCVFELTEAKRARRPIVLLDVGLRRISRTYPYGANLPRVRVSVLDAPSIEALLVEILSEGLRCDLFMEGAQDRLASAGLTGLILPRPPELLDFVVRKLEDSNALIVHPDPPLPDIERDLVNALIAGAGLSLQLKTLGELS